MRAPQRPRARKDQILRWVELARSGLQIADIHDLDGTPRQTICRHLWANGIRCRPGRRPHRARAAMVEELAEGVRAIDIAARYDSARSTVYLLRATLEMES